MTTFTTPVRVALITTGILLLAGTVMGQTALGGGRALDGGLSNQPGGRVNASVSDLQAIVRVNTNAGNALNGPGFYGSSFSGGTLSNNYTRSSLLSSSNGLLASTSSPLGSALGSPSPEVFDRVAVLEAGYLPGGSLTSSVNLPQGSIANDYRRSVDPSVGYASDGMGNYAIVRGSALRGMTVDPMSRIEATTVATDNATSGTAATYNRVIDELRRASLARALDNPNRVDNSVNTQTPSATNPTPGQPNPAGTDSTTGKPANPANPKDTANPANPTPGAPVQYNPDAALKRLRERLAAKPKVAAPIKEDTRKPDSLTAPDPSNSAATTALTEEDINALRAMGLKLDTLVPPDATDAQAADGYTRLGQEALTSGHFGLADQMFQSAISRAPNNALAQAGRIHATMGLGLLMTAGADLRAYFVEHPEMIPVRFDTALLVPKARAERLADMLTTDLDRVDGPMLENAGLTLAYLGRQFENQAWLTKGLDSMAVQTKNDPQGTELLSLLRRVWNVPATPAAPPATAPAKPAAPPATAPAKPAASSK